MHVTEGLPGSRTEPLDPVAAARVAIWRLFEQGYVDEDMATAGLLAVDLGTRRTHRKAMLRHDDALALRDQGGRDAGASTGAHLGQHAKELHD